MQEILKVLPQLIKPGTSLQQSEDNWKAIVESFFDINVVDDYNLACICATVKVETASTFAPIKEYGNRNYFTRMYWTNVRTRKQLGNLTQADAYTFYGRGYIQLTGRNNYLKVSEDLKIPDLLQNPDIACEPLIAGKVLAWYWEKHGLVGLCEQLKTAKPDYYPAMLMEIRRRVNGGLNGLGEFLSTLKILGLD